MRYDWHLPLDPDCPGAKEATEKMDFDDPISRYYGVSSSDFHYDWEDEHRKTCKRCQEYGAANIEVRD